MVRRTRRSSKRGGDPPVIPNVPPPPGLGPKPTGSPSPARPLAPKPSYTREEAEAAAKDAGVFEEIGGTLAAALVWAATPAGKTGIANYRKKEMAKVNAAADAKVKAEAEAPPDRPPDEARLLPRSQTIRPQSVNPRVLAGLEQFKRRGGRRSRRRRHPRRKTSRRKQ